ncbi:type II toxin-antitoxin system RelE/ParE family toxin [Aquimarina mytili]|uniref:type II toxin-antitoxin system RelE/ParE family toxin n=1 Tax=Aquimarina mytili TaxID=874423 RepID=UPI00293D672C|nr:type II toxin-antitoxin system RelE/ParE family toxin [Aquimarina mytili]
MGSYKLTDNAREDIDDLFEDGKYKFGHIQAIDYLIGLDELLETLAQSPTIGRYRNEIKQGLLSYPYQAHIVFYRIRDNQVVILRILYGGMDLPRRMK